jgi:hypothetical protein
MTLHSAFAKKKQLQMGTALLCLCCIADVALMGGRARGSSWPAATGQSIATQYSKSQTSYEVLVIIQEESRLLH